MVHVVGAGRASAEEAQDGPMLPISMPSAVGWGRWAWLSVEWRGESGFLVFLGKTRPGWLSSIEPFRSANSLRCRVTSNACVARATGPLRRRASALGYRLH